MHLIVEHLQETKLRQEIHKNNKFETEAHLDKSRNSEKFCTKKRTFSLMYLVICDPLYAHSCFHSPESWVMAESRQVDRTKMFQSIEEQEAGTKNHFGWIPKTHLKDHEENVDLYSRYISSGSLL